MRPLRHGCRPAPRAPKQPFLILLLLQCPLPDPYFVYPSTPESHVLSIESNRWATLAAHAARREALPCTLLGEAREEAAAGHQRFGKCACR
ncbi:hypothetical protein EDB89DRAFT_1924922 [Lactarius sanguifluus]|nr:hypothetical protein EDB89DRAFT_1924922 [Lactarius sanguifluus]